MQEAGLCVRRSHLYELGDWWSVEGQVKIENKPQTTNGYQQQPQLTSGGTRTDATRPSGSPRHPTCLYYTPPGHRQPPSPPSPPHQPLKLNNAQVQLIIT